MKSVLAHLISWCLGSSCSERHSPIPRSVRHKLYLHSTNDHHWHQVHWWCSTECDGSICRSLSLSTLSPRRSQSDDLRRLLLSLYALSVVLDAVDDSLGKPITFLKDAYQNVNYYLDSIRTQKDTAKNKFRSIVAIVKDTYVSMKYSKDQSIQLFKEKKDDLSTSIFSLIFFYL